MGNKIEYFDKIDVLYIAQLVKGELDKYVKAVEGKGLSDNNFTNALLNKLNGVDTGAEVNVQSDWSQTDSTKDDYIKNKPTIPSISGLAPLNSPAFTGTPTAPDPDTNEASKIATISYVLRALADISGIEFKKVASKADLPVVGEKGVIYLVPKTNPTNDIYTEYYWVAPDGGKPGFYETLGDTSIDLSGYLKEEDLKPIPESEIKAAWDSVFNK